ncbi:MAG: hypothetical protein GF350_08550, partial [Chitinivibrionales bacterium]|nr:hypothetical protein [Chitinivibrionales bacterium]
HICGFANAQGGSLLIGVCDNGNATGIKDCKKLLEDIPNKAVHFLGMTVSVDIKKKGAKQCIEVSVPPSPVPISYNGKFFIRSGSTVQ